MWAFFHFNLTQFIFPAYLIADHIGVSTNIIRRWFVPWERTDEHLPLSHIAEVSHIRGFFWDAISVESSGGANPLVVTGLPKGPARYFVEHVRERLNEARQPAGTEAASAAVTLSIAEPGHPSLCPRPLQERAPLQSSTKKRVRGSGHAPHPSVFARA